jgi:hypothetical protein
MGFDRLSPNGEPNLRFPFSIYTTHHCGQREPVSQHSSDLKRDCFALLAMAVARQTTAPGQVQPPAPAVPAESLRQRARLRLMLRLMLRLVLRLVLLQIRRVLLPLQARRLQAPAAAHCQSRTPRLYPPLWW